MSRSQTHSGARGGGSPIPESGSPARALLWDNDGVLVDTEHLFFRATCETFSESGISVSQEIYVDYAMRHGRSLFELVAERGAARGNHRMDFPEFSTRHHADPKSTCARNGEPG